MAEIVHTFLQEHLYRSALVIVICMGALIISMGVDLFFGIKKAKENGLATTSTGFKKTCDKARKYFSPFMVTVCIDLIACTVLPFPVFSMIWAGYCVFCEFVSVREKSWQKAEIRKQEKTVSILLENKEDLARAFAEIKKEPVKPEIIVQYQNSEVDTAAVEERVKAQFVAEGHKAGFIRKLNIYIKPEEYSAYYVINDKFSGRVDLF